MFLFYIFQIAFCGGKDPLTVDFGTQLWTDDRFSETLPDTVSLLRRRSLTQRLVFSTMRLYHGVLTKTCIPFFKWYHVAIPLGFAKACRLPNNYRHCTILGSALVKKEIVLSLLYYIHIHLF